MVNNVQVRSLEGEVDQYDDYVMYVGINEVMNYMY